MRTAIHKLHMSVTSARILVHNLVKSSLDICTQVAHNLQFDDHIRLSMSFLVYFK